MKVQVYKNLHRGDWSVRCKGRVIAHMSELTLANVSFHVSESARTRVIANRRREVHAWAVGEIVASQPSGEAEAITYNPYVAATFTLRRTGAAIMSAAVVRFTERDGAYAYV